MSATGRTGQTRSLEAIWHDVECGSYTADLATWSQIAREAAGPVLELGAGTGRVSLYLARQGFEIHALDRSEELLAELARRAAGAGLELATTAGDGRAIVVEGSFAAVLAPMQFVHLLGGSDGRTEMLRSARGALTPGGVLAAAVLSVRAEPTAQISALPPDVREIDGWVYSSLPLELAAVDDGVELRRLRQVVSPEGELSEQADGVRLDHLDPAELEREARTAGFEPRERIDIPPTDDHVGSLICVLEAC